MRLLHVRKCEPVVVQDLKLEPCKLEDFEVGGGCSCLPNNTARLL